MPRFITFDGQAKKVMTYANEEAQRHGHDFIGPEYLLVGLLRDETTLAARALHSLAVTLSAVRSAVDAEVAMGRVVGDAGLTPRAKRVIELAVEEDRRLGHDYLGTEHLLLGLVREEAQNGDGILGHLGVNGQDVRDAVHRFLSMGP